MNRPRERAVYRCRGCVGARGVAGIASTDEERGGVAADLRRVLRRAWAASSITLAAEGPFLVLDVHSYNHRRDGAAAPPAPAAENPEVNVGTGSLDRQCWGAVVSRFMDELGRQGVDGQRLDVRENVRFRGGHLSRGSRSATPVRAARWRSSSRRSSWTSGRGSPTTRHLGELRRALAERPAVVASGSGETAMIVADAIRPEDLAIDHELADIGGEPPLPARRHAGQPDRGARRVPARPEDARRSSTGRWRMIRR